MLQLRFLSQDKPPVWLVENHYVLGSDSHCNLPLAGAGVQPRHAELFVDGEQLTIVPGARGAAVSVDGLLISQPTPLTHNSRLSLGDIQLQVVDPKKQADPKKPQAEPAAEVREWYLVSTTTALANRQFPIGETTVVGRSAECDISLGVAHLSRKHARLWLEGEALWVEDLGSSNGTFVNNLRVGRSQLHNGDLLGLDTLVFAVAGGPSGVEPDGHKTSLRPALSVAGVASQAALSVAPAPPAPVKPRAAEKNSTLRPHPPADAANPNLPAGPGWPLWLGLALVGLLTLLAVVYLLS